MASVRRIAELAGVSVATVSRVLNNHPHVDSGTRRRVLAAADSQKYVRIGQRSQAVLGLVYPGEVVKADYGSFDLSVLSGVLEGVNEQRFDIKIVSMLRDKSAEETYSQFFARKGLRGVLLRTFEHTRRVCMDIAAEGFPAVVIADRFQDSAVNFAWTDSGPESIRAVRHLIELGHRRIALVLHSIADTDHNDRREAFMQAHREAGLPVDASLIVQNYASAENGANAVTQLMGLRSPPTALFITDPLATVGALRRCLELSIRVPSELSIIGFDDSDIRLHTFPMCSAVVQDARALGLEASRWLTRITSGQTEHDTTLHMVKKARFEINQTTAQPPATAVRVLPDGTRVLAEQSAPYALAQ